MYNSRASPGLTTVRGRAAPPTRTDRGREKRQRRRGRRAENRHEGQEKGFPSLGAWGSNFCGRAVPTRRPGTGQVFSSGQPSASPAASRPSGTASRVTARNEILHSCGDKGENGVGEVGRGAGDPPPLPAPAFPTEPGVGGGAGMVSWLKRKGAERGRVGVPGTCRHPMFPGDLGCRSVVTQKLVLRNSD